MTAVSEVAFSQQQSLSISRTREIEVSRSLEAQSLQTSLQVGVGGSSDIFQKVFDVVEISDEARSRLLKNRDDANALADFVQNGRRTELVLTTPQVSGRLKVDFAEIGKTERFSFSETYELNFLQESTLSVETDQGSFEITQSREVEASLSQAVEILRSSNQSFLSTSLGA